MDSRRQAAAGNDHDDKERALNEREPVVLQGQVVVDFSQLTSPEQLDAVGRIEDVGLVIVPQSLAAAYLAICVSGVAATVYVPNGAHVRTHTGLLVVPGDGIGAGDDVLIVIGALLITSPVTGPLPRQIHVTGLVLAPRGSESALGSVLVTSIGNISYYRYGEGQDIQVLTGQVTLPSAMLENRAGQPGDILLAAGEVVITGEVREVGYRLVVAGDVAAPESSREVLGPRLAVHGNIAWYSGASPRVFHGSTSLGAGFFRQLDEPGTEVSFGELVILPDVTESMLREKVRGFTLFGRASAPADLAGVIQFLATDVFQPIEASDGSRMVVTTARRPYPSFSARCFSASQGLGAGVNFLKKALL